MNAVLRVHYGIDPNELSDEDWARKFQDWIYVTRSEHMALEIIMQNALRKVAKEVLEVLYPKK